MQTYRYRAIDAEGLLRCGTLTAADHADLAARLARHGLELLRARRMAGVRGPRLRRTRARTELIHFSFQLEQLLAAGVPLVEALRDLAATGEEPAIRDVVAGLAEAIEGGATFSEALEEYPQLFDTVYVALVRVGERSGRLPAVLAELAATLQREHELRAQTRAILIYPVIAATVIAGVIAFLLAYLVPQLAAFLQAMDIELPAHTRLLLGASEQFLDGGWLMALLAIAVVWSLTALAPLCGRCRHARDALALRLWLFGRLALRVRLARFTSSFALMYAAGINVLDALWLCRGLMDNAVLERALDRARDDIAAGRGISDAFDRAGLFPPLVVRMLRVGETSGGLDRSLDNVSAFYTREVRETVSRIQPALLPLLTLVLGLVLGGFLLAVFGPVYTALTTMDV